MSGQKAPRPFPYIMHESGQRLELWLMVMENGTMRPLGQTGPVSLPSAWEVEYRAAIAKEGGTHG